MRAIQIKQPAQLANLHLADIAEPAAPGPGEITVRLHATSLNYHDYVVVIGGIPTPEGRIPMSDGAGVVEAVGEGVSEFQVGDAVVSTFFPDWLDGEIGAAETIAMADRFRGGEGAGRFDRLYDRLLAAVKARAVSETGSTAARWAETWSRLSEAPDAVAGLNLDRGEALAVALAEIERARA